MELVEATAADLDDLVERWYDLATAMEGYSELNELVYGKVDAVPDDGFRAHLDDDGVTDYLVVHRGETVGFLTLSEGRHPSRRYSRYLRLVNLAIDEGHRSRGHGAAVVERVEELARERGCDHLKVSCEWHNEDARRFYRDTGFRPKQVDYARPLE
ncbi:GNAT family N-acetyltransferase [Halomarina litorea]|uniref:GNAT family N-acetyltransferase n=1 Tax=Halomarina litorea TaxID=2961595 RepID=UPI0020C2D36F|nr:GNAT family N-acetyltransferase [Halomarina sp. BCD28]